MGAASQVVGSSASTGARWVQLMVGITGMVAIANLQEVLCPTLLRFGNALGQGSLRVKLEASDRGHTSELVYGRADLASDA